MAILGINVCAKFVYKHTRCLAVATFGGEVEGRQTAAIVRARVSAEPLYNNADQFVVAIPRGDVEDSIVIVVLEMYVRSEPHQLKKRRMVSEPCCHMKGSHSQPRLGVRLRRIHQQERGSTRRHSSPQRDEGGYDLRCPWRQRPRRSLASTCTASFNATCKGVQPSQSSTNVCAKFLEQYKQSIKSIMLSRNVEGGAVVDFRGINIPTQLADDQADHLLVATPRGKMKKGIAIVISVVRLRAKLPHKQEKHFATVIKPQCNAEWRGVPPSLSLVSISAPNSSARMRTSWGAAMLRDVSP